MSKQIDLVARARDLRTAANSRHVRSNKSIDELIRAQDPYRSWPSYWRIIDALRSSSGLLGARQFRNGKCLARAIVRGCMQLAGRSNRWYREPEFWAPAPESIHSAHLTWCDFVSHLFDAYPAPGFLALVWLNEYQLSWERDFHIHIGLGRSPRNFEVPHIGRLPKSIVSHFMAAPRDAGVVGAIRWAQVMAAGGDRKLARLIMHRIPLSEDEGWEECWRSVIRFLVRHQPVSKEETVAIIEFVRSQRFQPARQTVGIWMSAVPVDKSLNLDGWTLRRLRRHMVNWRDAFPIPSDLKMKGWYPSRYRPFEKRIDGLTWRIVELCSNYALRREGERMQHCVGQYARYCRKGECSIWSIRCSPVENRIRSILTVDVDPKANRIVEAKGKANGPPSRFATGLLREWAKQEGIDGGGYIQDSAG